MPFVAVQLIVRISLPPLKKTFAKVSELNEMKNEDDISCISYLKNCGERPKGWLGYRENLRRIVFDDEGVHVEIHITAFPCDSCTLFYYVDNDTAFHLFSSAKTSITSLIIRLFI